jgi:hypothetical protein
MAADILAWQEGQYQLLRAAAGVELAPEEERTRRWIARWDLGTVDAVAELLKKIRAAATARATGATE